MQGLNTKSWKDSVNIKSLFIHKRGSHDQQEQQLPFKLKLENTASGK